VNEGLDQKGMSALTQNGSGVAPVRNEALVEVRNVWRRRTSVFLSSWETVFFLIVVTSLVILSLVPESAWPASTTTPNLADRNAPPRITGNDSEYLFGADALGRDVFYRMLAGARLTLLIAGLATIISTLLGVTAGIMAGYFGGFVDTLISRVVDIFLAFPTLLLVLALVSAIGQSSWAVIGVLALSGWAGFARVVRSSTLQLSEREFIEAARCVGASSGTIILRHLLPNIVTPIVVLSTVNLGSFILTESAISFLGLGPAPPEFTWGGLIGDGRNSIYDAPWSSVFPGIAIVVTVISFGFLGDAIRDAFDPSSQLDKAGKGGGVM
jgi:peptide/nickel transport system permease protein